LRGIDAQAKVVVAPDAHGIDLLKQPNRFRNAFAHFENVAQDHEAVGPMLSQHVDGLPQLLRVFVNVG
jgi:hypothetical protein